jgi:ABC-type Fe3+/spermidine/putrescine transport system ATPase subunit
MAVSDRIIVMNAGRIEQQGVPRKPYERPATSARAPRWVQLAARVIVVED